MNNNIKTGIYFYLYAFKTEWKDLKLLATTKKNAKTHFCIPFSRTLSYFFLHVFIQPI